MKVRSAIESSKDASHFPAESAQGIARRARSAREAFGAEQKGWAALTGVPVGSIKKYEGAKSVPGGEALAGYVRAGINANWLLTGEGAMLLKDLKAVPPGALDPDHLKAVITGVESALQEQRLTLDPDKKGELVLALYELTRDSGIQPQRATILRLVRSAA